MWHSLSQYLVLDFKSLAREMGRADKNNNDGGRGVISERRVLGEIPQWVSTA